MFGKIELKIESKIVENDVMKIPQFLLVDTERYNGEGGQPVRRNKGMIESYKKGGLEDSSK